MRQLTLWRIALFACTCAAAVLMPLAIAATWLARKAQAGESRADLEILRARARHRVDVQRKAVRR